MIDRRTMLAYTAAGASLAPTALAAATAAEPRGSRAFPQGFLWGASTSAHQIEGNNTNSDAWALEQTQPTTYAEPSGDAANSFALWRKDLDIVQALGLNTYRFGLEWARIEPAQGQFSVAMLDHYKAIVDGCHERGLTPLVTFSHFTLPAWFAARGGWTAPDGPDLFGRFCDRAARHMSDGIAMAITLNEPNLRDVLNVTFPASMRDRIYASDRAMQEAAARNHGVERFEPGNPLWVADPEAREAALLRAHAEARAAIRAVRSDLPVGLSLAIVDDQAAGAASMRDRVREQLYGNYLAAARQDEFIGVQNYGRKVWGETGALPPPADATLNDSEEEIYAPSLAGAVRYAHEASGVPIMVTEHGVNTADDRKRADLIPAALGHLRDAMAEGVPVLGYCHWSLLDNFEWVFGYGPKYGLCAVDRTTFARTPKPSAQVLGRIAQANAV